MALFLPPELWDRIFSFNTDVDEAHAWTQGRLVNRAWEKEIERTFKDDYLCNPRSHKHHLAVEMIFDRFDPENSTRLVFTEGETRLPCDGKQSEKYKRAYMRKKYRAWRQNIIYYLCEEGDDAGDSQFDSPPRVICVGDPVNDTELPGLSVDYETKKISFE